MLALYADRSTCNVREAVKGYYLHREIQKQATSNSRDFMKAVELNNIGIQCPTSLSSGEKIKHCKEVCLLIDSNYVKYYLISRGKERHYNGPSFRVFTTKNRYQTSKHSPNNFWWCAPAATKSTLKTKDSPKAVLFRKWPRPPAEVLSA